jgi:hypothetical protein
MIETESASESKIFFISYASDDEQWAEWIAMQLEDAGYKAIFEKWDFLPGSNVVMEMNNAIKRADRTLLVLSRAYLKSDQDFAEWAVMFRQDFAGKSGKILPVRIEPCDVEGLLGSIIYIDLVELKEAQARERLLAGVRQERKKPKSASFPETSYNVGGTTPGEHEKQNQDRARPSSTVHTLPPAFIQQIEGLLRNHDYDEAYYAIDRILRGQQDIEARQLAWLKYMQGLVYLRGSRPRDHLPTVVQATGSLISQAIRGHQLQAYAAVLAAIECDFAQSGLRRKNVNTDHLIKRAAELPYSHEDQAITNIFAHVQSELYRDFRRFFKSGH